MIVDDDNSSEAEIGLLKSRGCDQKSGDGALSTAGLDPGRLFRFLYDWFDGASDVDDCGSEISEQSLAISSVPDL